MTSLSKHRLLFVLALGLGMPLLAAAPGAAAEEPAEKANVQEIALGTTPDSEDFSGQRQSVALLADGSYATAWIDHQLGAQMQWVRPDGTPVFAGGGRSLTSPSNVEADVVVVSNPAGGAFTAVSRFASNIGHQIFVQSYDAAGNPRWPADGVFAATLANGDDHLESQLIAAPQGGVYLCFQQFHAIRAATDDNGSDIVCQRFAADGRRLWGDRGIKAGGQSGFKVVPRTVRDDRNGLLVFWRNDRDGRLDPKDFVLIEGQHFAPDGSRSWGARGKILRTTGLAAGAGDSQSTIGAVTDGQGGAVVAFDDGLAGGESDVFAQRIAGNGRLLWGNGLAVATGKPYQVHDSITAAPDGGAFVTVWQPAGYGSQRLILFRLGANGKILWHQLLSTTASGRVSQDWGAYGSFDSGRLRLAWNRLRQDGSGGVDLVLGIFDLAGHRLNGPSGTTLTRFAFLQFVRGFVFDPARKQGFVIWEVDPSGDGDDDTMGGIYRE